MMRTCCGNLLQQVHLSNDDEERISINKVVANIDFIAGF
jgi:hypothetical protein